MWPFSGDQQGLWLACYVLTLALHAVFVAYVLVGTVYATVQALRKTDDPLAEQVRDYLPFMLGCGITAGQAAQLRAGVNRRAFRDPRCPIGIADEIRAPIFGRNHPMRFHVLRA